MIAVQDLNNLKDTEEFTLINVHIPLEGNIPDTDAEIPFDDVESYIGLLPDNKEEKIIIYCRSGSMGDIASQTLVNLGYTDVLNLEGGYNAWKAIGLRSRKNKNETISIIRNCFCFYNKRLLQFGFR